MITPSMSNITDSSIRSFRPIILNKNSTLTARILNQPPEQIFISIITIEEILQGALASIQKEKRKPSVTKTYQYFEVLFAALRRFQILSYISYQYQE